LKSKFAFTMIELVFVIVVLGILASLAMGRMERDAKQEASSSILAHIRLAQQLALNDNKHRSDNNTMWQTAYWRFEYEKCDGAGVDRYIYRVGSDRDLSGGINKIESAIDPINGKYIWADGACNDFDDLSSDESRDVYLYGRFGVENISHSSASGSCTSQNIGFDFLGRPHTGLKSYKTDNSSNFQKLMTKDCILTFTMSDGDTFTIRVEAETGHAYIEGQENS
jgi:prepilin-type N-terminal cleavage/methylation domain-containing protein